MKSAAVVVDHGEDAFEEDACSIRLEPFSSQDPATSVKRCITFVNANTTSNCGDDAMLAPTKCSKKRPRKTEVSEQNKKKKTKKSNVSDHSGSVVTLPLDEPRKWIQRVWDENDEIVILKGMIDYIENGGDPYVDATGFLDAIRGSLHLDPTVKKLKSKICKLKTKYDNIAKKRRADDEDPVFAKPHELKCYGLWKEIWGPNNCKSGSVGIRTHKKKIKSDSEMGADANRKLSSKVIKPNWSLFPCLTDLMGFDSDSFEALFSPGERFAKEEKKNCMSEKGNLKVEDVKAYLKWIDLLREKVTKVDKLLESSDFVELS